MKHRLAIFDFDGTLSDSYPWFVEIVNEMADRYRFRRVEPHDLEVLRGLEARKIIEHLGMPMWKTPLVARHFRQRMAAELGRISLFPGAREMLRTLHERGVMLAIVTSNSEANVRRLLGADAALIRHYGCEAGLFGKRSKLRKALRAAGLRSADAIAIGDEIRDAHAARAEGIAFGAVSWGYTTMEALSAHSPEMTFTSMAEIAEKL
jgi:phosphoglycolate phosphatase